MSEDLVSLSKQLLKERRTSVRLLACIPGITDGTSWYRAAGPLARMAELYPLDVIYNNCPSWADIANVDAVFLQRPDSEAAVHICKLVTAMGKKLWLDFDDNLMSVPEYNMSYQSWGPQVVQAIKDMGQLCSFITVSTPAIYESLQGITPNLFLVPNAVDFQFYDKFKIKRKRTDDTVRIMWRGSDSQNLQLRALAPFVLRSLKEFPQVSWILMCGSTPYQFLRSAPPERCIWQRWNLIPECFITLLEYQPDIHVSLLFDEMFDKSRSPGSLIESAPSGAAFLGPDWWQVPGQTLYTPGNLDEQPLIQFTDAELNYAAGNFYEKLCELIHKTPEERLALNQQTVDFFRANASLDRAADYRWRLFCTVLDKPVFPVQLEPKILKPH